jgi:Raf kinase inhibitor-like YbhB/YbcL family protein
MQLTSSSFDDGQPIPTEFAFCAPGANGSGGFGGNKNPHLRWVGDPVSTRSFAIVCHDPDAPAYGDGVNEEGQSVEHDRERTDFYHWVLVNIPADVSEIPAGALSDGVTARGKTPGASRFGLQGINSYTDWFDGDDDMEGTYGGYDGPCPPWNDERLHHYHFTLYALDTDELDVDESGDFTAEDVLDAIEGHVLAEAVLVGTYTTNPNVR